MQREARVLRPAFNRRYLNLHRFIQPRLAVLFAGAVTEPSQHLVIILYALRNSFHLQRNGM